MNVSGAILALFDGTRVGNALRVLLNRYEAAAISSPDRGWVPSFVRDARYDANSFTRWEMFRKIVYFEENNWLAGRIRDEYVKWTVGPNGLRIIAHSSDSEWNKRMEEAYLEWCEAPFLDSSLSMTQGHRLMAGSEHFHGELFCGFTHLKLSGKPATPAIQFIESPRCSSPGKEFAVHDETDGVVDGVQLAKDVYGKWVRPSGYWIRDTFEGDEWNFRSTADMSHIFEPKRIGMYRNVTPYHAVLNGLQDMHELDVLGMQRAKQIAQVSYWISTASGELNADTQRLSKWGTVPSQGTAGTTETYDQFRKRIEQVRKSLGAHVEGIKLNEKVAQFASESPSVAEQWYMVYKMGQITGASNVPMVLIFPELIEKIQGTAVRGILDNAHEFFRGKSHLFSVPAVRNYRYFANWARFNKPELVDAPADWKKCDVILPRAVNVDSGRNAASDVLTFNAGMKSLDDIAGAQGTTAEVLLRKKARNIAMAIIAAQEVSEEFSTDGRIVEVKPEQILGGMADVAQKMAMAEETGEDEETENPKEESVA
jgi:hypothetical protein